MKAMETFKKEYKELLSIVDDSIAALIVGGPDRLQSSIMYSLFGGGKRLRPILFLSILKAYKHKFSYPDYLVAVAIECIHTYSLIHDDLPCMDNDDERRGMPTNHIQFDEATALLAGDSLLNVAYELLLKAGMYGKKYIIAGQLIAKNAGAVGMIGGQSLEFENFEKEKSESNLLDIYDKKCSKLIEAAILSAVIISNHKKDYLVWEQIGYDFGLCFQLKDDLLDEESQTEFETLLNLWGREKTQSVLNSKLEHIVDNVSKLKINTTFLSSLINVLLIRNEDGI